MVVRSRPKTTEEWRTLYEEYASVLFEEQDVILREPWSTEERRRLLAAYTPLAFEQFEARFSDDRRLAYLLFALSG